MDNIVRFLRWWLDELRGLLPAGLRGESRRRRTLLLRVGTGGIDALLVTGDLGDAGSSTPLGGPELESEIAAAAAGRTDLVAYIDETQVLTRTVDLPAAARENLREVLEFELLRLTPFQSSEVHFEFRVLDAGRGGDSLKVELNIVRRTVLDDVREFLSPHDFQWAGAVAVAGERDLYLRLEPTSSAARRSPWPRRLVWSANAAVAAGVVLIAQGQLDERIAALREQVRAERQRAEAVQALRERADAIAAEREALITYKRDTVPRIEILRELTDRLPDSAWIQRLEVKDAQVLVTGSAAAASPLIAAVEESPLFRSATFPSPVTRIPATGGERFRLAVEVVRKPR